MQWVPNMILYWILHLNRDPIWERIKVHLFLYICTININIFCMQTMICIAQVGSLPLAVCYVWGVVGHLMPGLFFLQIYPGTNLELGWPGLSFQSDAAAPGFKPDIQQHQDSLPLRTHDSKSSPPTAHIVQWHKLYGYGQIYTLRDSFNRFFKILTIL
jgi:hypothetical protein